ncbi:MAG TPA: hypothetical protein VE736_03220 [Gaiellaceae bacterium]|jgi:hypothetical protein|nr:hypothetical protein [Gaiellaceae bacterium]
MTWLRWPIRPELLQWVGLFGAALGWTAQHITGFGVTVAECGAGSSAWHLNGTAWQITLIVVGELLILVAEAAAITVLVRTWGVEEDDAPPLGRQHFFAMAAAVGNVLFFVMVLLSGIGTLVTTPCHQA